MRILPRYLILPLIVVCIVAAAIIILYHLYGSRGTSVVVPPRGTDTSRKPAAAPESHEAEGSIHSAQSNTTAYDDFTYPLDSTRDPFQQVPDPADIQQPPGPAVDEFPIMLTGIIWDEEDPTAIVIDAENNSYLMKIGEEIGKAKLLAIRPGSIIIEAEGKTQELVLWPAKL